MPKLIRALVLVTTLMGALAAPEPALADCVGARRACLNLALAEDNGCSGGCNSTGCWYVCEWLYDMDRAGCWSAWAGCINPIW